MFVLAEEVILAEERTTEAEKMHIMEGEWRSIHKNYKFFFNLSNFVRFSLAARRRNAAKRKKLKSLGKSKSTDTEEEEGEEDYGDDGMYRMTLLTIYKT